MDSGKVREFWIDDVRGVHEDWEEHWDDVLDAPREKEQFHVIEKRAFNELKKERDELKGKLGLAIDSLKQIAGQHETYVCDDELDCKMTAEEALKEISK